MSAPALLDHADLRRRLLKALGVAKRAVTVLGESGYRADDEPDGSFGPDKLLAETAMLLHVASGLNDDEQVKLCVHELALLIQPHARAERVAIGIALYPSICLQLAMPHVLLSRLGHLDARFDRLLELSLQSSASLGREIVPHRALERTWIQAVWRGTTPDSAIDLDARRSVLNHPLDLLHGARDDGYAHTHALMYFTNFGFWRRPFPRSCADILAESSALLARALLRGDYDLAVEVLMAWSFAEAPLNAAARFGFRVLAELEDQVGFLPAKNGTPAGFAQRAGEARTRYALAAAYHTVYVMGMLCALVLRTGERTSQTSIVGPHVSHDTIMQLLKFIPDADSPWRQTLSRLIPSESCALGPLLRDMALISCASNGDIDSMRHLLELSLVQGLADVPTCAQAVELLSRVAACA